MILREPFRPMMTVEPLSGSELQMILSDSRQMLVIVMPNKTYTRRKFKILKIGGGVELTAEQFPWLNAVQEDYRVH